METHLGYSDIKEEYPKRIEKLESKIRLRSEESDIEHLFNNPEIPKIVSSISKIEEAEWEELEEVFDTSTLSQMVDYGLLDQTLDHVEVSREGEEYLEILNELHENTYLGLTTSLDEDAEDIDLDCWISESETRYTFDRYHNEATMKDVFGENEKTEDLEDLPDDPEWFGYHDQYTETDRNPDWVVKKN